MTDDYPNVSGRQVMARQWSIELPAQFKRRVEDGALVFWRPGLTVWVNVWGNDKNQTADDRLARIRRDNSSEAYDIVIERFESLLRYSYRLAEPSDDTRVPALYSFAIGHTGHVQMAAYFDQEADLSMALQIWRGLQEHEAVEQGDEADEAR